jgi:N-acetylglucosaminyldiphosphoundecaprenol N-acetyl-beta-D-mannosaminyltransferase
MRKLAAEKHGGYICVSNVHTVVTGQDDPRLQNSTNGSLISTADGMPLVWVSRFLKPRIQGRASGPDIMAGFFSRDITREFRHGLYGSTPQVLEQLKEQIQTRWPGTQIVCSISPPFGRPVDHIEEAHLLELQNAAPHILWVGLGAPRQEIWMAANHLKLPHTIMIGVGAAFDFLSGNKPRAPLWMQKAGLEWLHRLSSEPKRLFWRYLNTNSRFVFYIFRSVLFGRKGHS